MWYILDKRNRPVPVEMLEGALWLEQNRERRILHQTHIGKVFISTVFLSLDHAYPPFDKKPLLYETMIFKLSADDEYQWRYTTRWQARRGHWKAVCFVLYRLFLRWIRV